MKVVECDVAPLRFSRPSPVYVDVLRVSCEPVCKAPSGR
jgi:hypothetical protein